MIMSFFRKRPANEPVYSVYAQVVAQSRQVVFYADWGVPDTLTGRFDMISLHLALVFRRLRGTAEAREFSQALFDLFFKDMDRSLRELGVGDLSVAKKIRTMGSVFYGLLANLDTALEGRGDLAQVLKRNIYGGEAAPGLPELTDYVRREDLALRQRPLEGLLAGHLDLGIPIGGTAT